MRCNFWVDNIRIELSYWTPSGGGESVKLLDTSGVGELVRFLDTQWW